MNTWRRTGSALVGLHERPRISSVCVGLEVLKADRMEGEREREIELGR